MDSESNNAEKREYVPTTTDMLINLEMLPNLEYLFEILEKKTKIITRHAGRSSLYKKDRHYQDNRKFVQYFIMKYISQRFGKEITNVYMESILQNPEKCEKFQNVISFQDLRKHYEIYKDINTKAMDAIESIKIVSLSFQLMNGETIPPLQQYKVNENNMKEVIRYFEKLPYKEVDFCLNLDCDYFKANFICYAFDNDVIYFIKPNRYMSLDPENAKVEFNNFYEAILCGFGLYKKTNIKVKKFKIYNPILGDEHSIVLNDLDYELLEKVLKLDTERFSRIMQLLKERRVLNMSLFEKNVEHK